MKCGTQIDVRPGELGKKLIADHKARLDVIKRAARAAAFRLKAYLVEVVKQSGITDRGTYKGSFRVVDESVLNDAPHAGIIELGARPHPVSKEGQEAIKQWCMRKLKLSESEAASVAYLICQKIKKEGQKPHYFMRDAIPKAIEFFEIELKRLMKVEVVSS